MRRVAALLAVCLLVAGCAQGSPAGPDPAPSDPAESEAGTAEPDPVDLIGSWTLSGTELGEDRGAVLRIAPDDVTLWRLAGVLMGNWRADTNGLFVAHIHGGTAGSPATPAWLARAVGFRADGDARVLLDAQGATVARLEPGGTPSPVPNLAPDMAKAPTVTDDARRKLQQPAAPLPPGLAAAGRDALVRRWLPDRGPARAYVELLADGAWRGSDGCNGMGGRWAAGPDGAFLAVSGPTTLIACGNATVDVDGARRAGLDGGTLVLLDASGAELARLRPAS